MKSNQEILKEINAHLRDPSNVCLWTQQSALWASGALTRPPIALKSGYARHLYDVRHRLSPRASLQARLGLVPSPVATVLGTAPELPIFGG